ncbi:6-phosphogluconolactonase [Tieghemostelium lacteum]|uniref:6-phosphogluconolactonase n=1 Tax=Tieghemostelium lacteum TaxID=361077 RepID=A0A151ZJF6_TIELA|nr:6-phosphogluconolactonase [Tieghemostelium lacteum]|eukprot:KYQ94045.1 6-phosphogluconolactonase [Tieghemostelium lacteum]
MSTLETTEKLIDLIKFREFTESKDYLEQSVKFIQDAIKEGIASRGIAVIGLSGGTSPREIYNRLTVSGDCTSIKWEKVYFFCVDERYIEKTSKDSIYDLISGTIFQNEPMSKLMNNNFIHPNTSLPLKECIQQYSLDLSLLLTKSSGIIDLVTLGMGEDGHIASIFPNGTVSPTERSEMVYHTTTDRFAIHDRITTSIKTLSQAYYKLFFMNGSKKKQVWDEMTTDTLNINRWPAQQIILSKNTHVHYLA